METVDDVRAALAEHEYLADEGLATAIFLAIRLQRPLLLEGEAGVGKTEVAKVLARWTGGELVRLQCYEGIDAAQAVYEWDYSRQLLHLRAVEAGGGEVVEDELYSERFLVKRPLLRAIAYEADGARRGGAAGAARRRGRPRRRRVRGLPARDPLRLHDHRSRARHVPRRRCRRSSWSRRTAPATCTTRSKRRCLYHWIAHPDFERELAILRVRAPEVPDQLAREVAAAVEALRELELYKPPGVAETIDWANALAALGAHRPSTSTSVDVTLGTILKYREDQERTRAAGIDQLVRSATERSG